MSASRESHREVVGSRSATRSAPPFRGGGGGSRSTRAAHEKLGQIANLSRAAVSSSAASSVWRRSVESASMGSPRGIPRPGGDPPAESEMAIDAPPGGSERLGEEANILESRAANSASVAAIAQIWCVSLSASANGGASSRDAHLLAPFCSRSAPPPSPPRFPFPTRTQGHRTGGSRAAAPSGSSSSPSAV